MDNLVPIDTIIPKPTLSDILQSYIGEHPEDAVKWLEFLNQANTSKIKRPLNRLTPGEINELIKDLNYPLNADLSSFAEVHPDNGCIFCKKTWAQSSQATTELLCGHKFHTLCFFIYDNETNLTRCPHCSSDCMRQIVSRVDRLKSRELISQVDTLMDAIVEREDFKSDLKELKKCIRNAAQSYNNYDKEMRNKRKALIRKHIHSINHIQHDMNQAVKDLAQSEAGSRIKTSMRIYRKKYGEIFRKYNITFRDLRERKLVKTTWRIRWMLEHHRVLNRTYRFGIRISPGKKTWREQPEEGV